MTIFDWTGIEREEEDRGSRRIRFPVNDSKTAGRGSKHFSGGCVRLEQSLQSRIQHRQSKIDMTRYLAYALMALAVVGAVGCVEESSTIVTFDTELESTTFNNRLLTPLVLYRDGEVLDTLPASQQRTYSIGRKGVIRHAWKIIPPLDRYGRKAGVEPYVDLGVQYVLNANYRIDNESMEQGPFSSSKTLFTPLVANFSPWPLRLIVNYQEDDQVITDYIVPRDISAQLSHAPYFYWHSRSNVRLESTTSWNYYFITRLDTNEDRQLRLDEISSSDGTGRTVPITVY